MRLQTLQTLLPTLAPLLNQLTEPSEPLECSPPGHGPNNTNGSEKKKEYSEAKE